ncbi:hypothetical protein FKW77_005405 [Venturia effusa]|uniref:Uncharacterized protein n=1 Tax=Venturia effusa TaxID=50376 RepID=A0A517LMV3_9PEZI|nr:hypothetical protein FKW77_005405 [Venturia effusa]
MPSYAYNNLPPAASSSYQNPPKRQQQPIYQNQTRQPSTPNRQKLLPPIPVTYTLTPQHAAWSQYILRLYYLDSHEKYYSWTEEDIAIDLAYRSIIDGISMDPASDVETHAVEVCLELVDKGVWRFCERRMEKIKIMVGGAM